MCSQKSHSALEFRIQIHPTTGRQTQWDEVWYEHGFDEHLNFETREVQFLWHVYPGALAINIKKHSPTYLKGGVQNILEERIIFMSMFNDIDWTKEGKTESQRSGSICDPIQDRTLVS